LDEFIDKYKASTEQSVGFERMVIKSSKFDFGRWSYKSKLT